MIFFVLLFKLLLLDFLWKQINYLALVKPINAPNSQSWRQIVKLDRVDPCALMKGAESNNLIKSIVVFYREQFVGFPKKCPFNPGNYSIKNMTVIDDSEDNFSRESTMFNSITPKLPNGIFRHVIRIWNDKDPLGFTLFWHVQHYDTMGDDRL